MLLSGFFYLVRAVGMRNKNREVNCTNRAVYRWHQFDRFGFILFTVVFLYRAAAVRTVTCGNGR
jgi:hypothetical protein